MDASPDFERAMLCRSFQDVIRDLANLELSDREELPETIKMLETHRGSFQGERGRTRLFPWERGMEIMIRRWIVACKRRGRCPPREPIPRPKVRLRAPGLRHFRGRSEFAMFVELDIGTAVNNDFPLLYGVDIHLDDNAPGDLYHGQQVYELSRLDNVIAYVRVDPTPGELKLGVSESGRLRESLENIPYRALTLVLQKVSSKDFVAQARAVCEEMQIPAKSPWLLVQNPLSPFATNPSLKGQYLSVETKFMTRTGPMAPKEARFSLRVGGD